MVGTTNAASWSWRMIMLRRIRSEMKIIDDCQSTLNNASEILMIDFVGSLEWWQGRVRSSTPFVLFRMNQVWWLWCASLGQSTNKGGLNQREKWLFVHHSWNVHMCRIGLYSLGVCHFVFSFRCVAMKIFPNFSQFAWRLYFVKQSRLRTSCFDEPSFDQINELVVKE